MKKYFEEKKRSLKFKLAGPGHKLSETSSSSQPSSSKQPEETPKRVDSKESEEQRSAILAAALQRTQSQDTSKKDNFKFKSKKAMAQKLDTDSSKKSTDEEPIPTKENEVESSAPGVFFKCPAIDEDLVLSKPEWKEKITAHLADLKQTDFVLGSILQIKSLRNENEADECILLIIRYLRNIIDNPDNEKYKSIRMGNPKFSEKILSVEGALDFLLAVGFVKEDSEEPPGDSYLKFRSETSDLEILIQSLLEINGFRLELYRDYLMIEPKDVTNELPPIPDDFFEITVADLKRQQLQRASQQEKESMLMTKKMRELEKEKNAPRKALYTRIRVKLPNEYIIQGTFSVKETFQCLRQFIDEHLDLDPGYMLMTPPAYSYDEDDNFKTFEELNLKPAVQLILKTTSEKIDFKG